MSGVLVESSYRRVHAGVADRVLTDLRSRILSGQLTRGTRLPSEKELAAHYEVSAPTIREVIRALSAMSLVEARHGAGTFVTARSDVLLSAALSAVVELENIDNASIIELAEMFYLKAASLAVHVAEPAELDGLLAAAERFSPAMIDHAYTEQALTDQEHTDQEYFDMLRQFLKELVAVSHNKLLISIGEFLIETLISLAQETARSSPSAWRAVAGQMRRERVGIAEALRARDDIAAQAAVRRYSLLAAELVGNLPR